MADQTSDVDVRMHKTLEILRQDLQMFRAGRASPNVLERIPVDYYGAPTPLFQIASITSPDPRSLLVQPYERKLIREIEQAIQKSDLGFNPSNDGHVIRIVVPPLSTQRRQELSKAVHKKVEEAKVAIRNCRRDAHDVIKRQEKDREHPLSADESKRRQEQLQKLTDGCIAEADQIGAAKQTEIMEG